MAKKNGLVVRRKISKPKRQASTSSNIVAIRADQISPPQEHCLIDRKGTSTEKTESLSGIEEGYRLLQAILESTSDGILVVNKDNEVLSRNEFRNIFTNEKYLNQMTRQEMESVLIMDYIKNILGKK